MNISLITTVLNEEKTIVNLLQSIESQSRKPDEVVIVDANSGDATVQLIKSFQKQSQLKIRLFHQEGNRAIGRNLAVNRAIGQGIVVTDAGCILDKNWLKFITQPLINKTADVVAGFYQMKTDTLFTRCSALFVGVTSHNLNRQTFLPSSRSLAFTKLAWKKVDGYPKNLDYAEDLVFAQKLKGNKTIKVVFEPRAWVEWTPPRHLIEFFTAIKNYTLGNIQARYWRHLRKNLLVAIRYLLFAILLFTLPLIFVLSFIPLYFLYTSIKFRHFLHHPLTPNLLFVLQLTADLAVLTGLTTGLLKLGRDSFIQTSSRQKRN